MSACHRRMRGIETPWLPAMLITSEVYKMNNRGFKTIQ